MATEKETFKLDLDARDFIAGADKAREAIGAIGDVKSLSGLISSIGTIGKTLAVLAAAGAAVKSAIDLTVEAEAVAKVNKQFEVLAENVGISANEIRDGLGKAVAGLADDTDVLKAASQAMVTLGDSARNIVPIMELARKVTSVMGGELLENFEKISMAIGTGNTRILRQIGLNVDARAAMIEYAKATNQAVAALTENERRQAIANAVLEKGRTILKGTTEETTTATLTLKRIGVEFKQLSETAAIFFDRAFGDAIRSALEKFRSILQTVNLTLKDTFGTEAEKSAAHAERLRLKVKELSTEISEFEEYAKSVSRSDPYGYSRFVVRQHQINQVREELRKYREELDALPPEKVEAAGGSGESVKITEEESAKKRLVVSKFEAELATMRLQRIDAEMTASDSAIEIEQLFAQKRVTIAEQAELQIRALKDQMQIDDPARSLDTAQKIEEIERKKVAEILRLEQNLFEQKVLWMEQEARLRARTSDGFAAGFKSAAARASVDVGNFAKLGATAFAAFETSAVSALMEIGSGSKSAAEAMKGFMFGALADIAEAQGKIMVAKAFLGDFAAGAAGAALLILAGFLRSQAKGSTAAIPSGEGGGGGVGVGQLGGFLPPTGPDQSALQQAEQKPKREVTIQIQGHYLDTEGSRRALMEMIRQETDATSFKYVEIGQGA